MNTPELTATQLEPGRPIVVGVSGGPDSLALLHCLHGQGLNLVAASFNHGLRIEAGEDVEHVRAIAASLGLPFVTGSGDAANHARDQGLSIEEAARELRYQFLFSEARKSGAQAVAVGHTADDQAETVLMHFLRGAGLAGLKGMPFRLTLEVFDPQIPLVRPLLGWTRAETEGYCQIHNLQPRSDATNNDIHYFRNRLRHELLPALEAYNPRIRRSLARTATTLQGDFELIEEVLARVWKSAVRSHGAAYVEFDQAALEGLSPALRRSLFRKAAFDLRPGLRDVDFEALERVATLRPVELAGGLKTLREGGSLFLAASEYDLPAREWPQVQTQLEIKPGSTALGNGWALECSQQSGPNLLEQASQNSEHYTLWLDTSALAAGLTMRPPQSGDRFEPLGMPRQSARLGELFINLKIPHRLRRDWPLVLAGGKIVWVAGLRRAEGYKLTEQSREAIRLELKKRQ